MARVTLCVSSVLQIDIIKLEVVHLMKRKGAYYCHWTGLSAWCDMCDVMLSDYLNSEGVVNATTEQSTDLAKKRTVA